MAESCSFCKIVRNEIPRSCVYEDKEVMAIMDMRPINEGHILVIPKKHYENIYDIPEREVAALFKIVKKIAHAVKKGVNAEGVTIVQNNGKAAGQVVFHLHVHIIPRYEGQEVPPRREIIETYKLDQVAKKIRQFI